MVTYLGMRILCILPVFLLTVQASSQLSSDNYTFARSSPAHKRVFEDFISFGGSVSAYAAMNIPIRDLNTAVKISVPLYIPFGGAANSRSVDDYDIYDGRSFSTGSGRLSLYREMEQYVGQVSRSDGHSCLLRAMCEVSANPHHEDGLLGDITNFLLTGSYSAPDQGSEEGKPYLTAQATGQLSGDCSGYHHECPVSFFKYFG